MRSVTRRRPGIPTDYGIAEDDEGMLSWDDVATTLTAAPIFWISTVTPQSGPHLIPIWGAFTHGTAFIEGGPHTRWARNLAGGDGRVHIGVDHGGMQVMVRGIAERTTVPSDVQRAVADAYEAKYPYRPSGDEFWEITPDHVLAWKTDTIEAFASTPTQFDFGGLE